ncbi:MAG: hypothetical protein HGA38_01735 [Candidatus Moranbacteria bacterium]|nr:hypothetical protein [Candidatus Moranbacteria bacterium]
MKFGLERRSKKSEAEGARKAKFEKPLTYLLSGMMLVGGAHGASKMAEKQAEAQREKQRKELVQRHEREMRARESDRERMEALAKGPNPIYEQLSFDKEKTEITAETIRMAADYWHARNLVGDHEKQFSDAIDRLERHWGEVSSAFSGVGMPNELALVAVQESYVTEDVKDGPFQLTPDNARRFHVGNVHDIGDSARGAAHLYTAITKEMRNRGVEDPAFAVLAYNGSFAVSFLREWKETHPGVQPTINDFCHHISAKVDRIRKETRAKFGDGERGEKEFDKAVNGIRINTNYLAKFEGTLRTVKSMQDDNRIHVTMVGHSDPSTLVAQGEKADHDRSDG